MSLWTIRDSNGVVFGFALTSFTSHLHLRLVCTGKRKGEGSALSGNILAHASDIRAVVKLEAITTKVAKVYTDVALNHGWSVFVGGNPIRATRDVEPTTVLTLGGYMPMEFRPPGRVVARTSPTRIVQQNASAIKRAKVRMRRMEDSDESSDDSDG